MFGKGIKLFKLLGFEVRVDISWVFLALLIVWTLAKGYFPYFHKDLSTATYWWMGVAGAFGLFASIVLHELSHSILARKNGIAMKGITLFIFGGVAEMESEPPSPKAEFQMAIAGPIASFLLSLVFYAVFLVGVQLQWPVSVSAVFEYLAWINGLLVAFNMVPAFPLDGGRVLRSILWARKGNIRWATRVTSDLGSAFGLLLIVAGILHILYGSPLGGIWWILIGMFLRGAAQASYQHMLVRKALEGEPVRRFMITEPVTVPPSISLEELVVEYIYHYHHKMYPVVEDAKLLGCITTRDVKTIPRPEWSNHQVRDLMHPCSAENTVGPDLDATKALSTMSRTGNSRLMVVEAGRLVGILGLKDALKFVAIKADLEQDELPDV